MSHLVCQYCSHRNNGGDARCSHCGGPLKDVERLLAPAVETAVVGPAEAVVAAAANVVKGTEKTVAKHFPWRLGVVAGVVLLVLGVFGVRSCSLPTFQIADTDPVRFLPPILQASAQCAPQDSAIRTTRCVIGANDPLLLGGIAGGRQIAFTVALLPPDRIAETLGRWRASGATVSDGPVIVAIGPASTVWFANPRTGFSVETDAFNSRAGAQTFLARTGLSRATTSITGR